MPRPIAKVSGRREGRSRSSGVASLSGDPSGIPPSTFEPLHVEASDARSAAAIGGARRRILESLAAGERTIPELAVLIGVHPATVRYHIGFLVHHGLVEEQVAEARGGRGRPPVRYRISRHARLAGFPSQHYELLAEIALRTLQEAEGEMSVRRLKGQGSGLARAMVRQVARDAGLARWGPEAFERHLLGDLLGRFGVVTEIVSREEDALTYRSLTCPFLELAERLPALVCDALDLGFHEGIDDVVGGETRRLSCMGHGDPYCEYRTAFRRRRSGGADGGSPEAGDGTKETDQA